MKYFKPAFQKFKKYGSEEWVREARWRGGFVPISKPIKSYGKKTLLIGDSAGHVIASVGAGILPSMIIARIAGNFIARALKKECNLREYEMEWKRVMKKQFNYAYYMDMLFWKIIRSERIRYYLLKKLCERAEKFYEKLTTAP